MNDSHQCDKTRRQCARCKTYYCDKCKKWEHPECPLRHDTNVPTTYKEPQRIISHTRGTTGNQM